MQASLAQTSEEYLSPHLCHLHVSLSPTRPSPSLQVLQRPSVRTGRSVCLTTGILVRVSGVGEMVASSGRGEPLHDHLRKTLTPFDGVCVILSIMIGSGIFASPGLVLQRAGSPGAAIIAWIASGLLVICASFCYSELGTMFPTAGGDFDYLSKAYGRSAAFSFAWYCFWVSKPGSQAIIATIFGNYIVSAIFGTEVAESSDLYSKCLAVVLVIGLTTLNCYGIRESTRLINFLTMVKLFQVICIVAIGLYFFLLPQSSTFDGPSPTVFTDMSLFGDTNVWNFGRAMIACLFAFDGWADLNFLLEELQNAEKMLPRILPFGIALVTICYVTANVSYFSVLSPEIAMNSKSIALNFGQVAQGPIFSTIMALGVAMSTMGAANGSIMTGGRAFYSVARAGQAPHQLAVLNSRDAPANALIAQAIWCIFLILVPGSSFSSLLDYFGPTSWIFYAFTGSAVILLRIHQPDLPRPYKMPLYPLPPVILCLLSFGLVLNSLIEKPLFTLLATGFVGLSIPIWGCYYSLSHASSPKSGYELIPDLEGSSSFAVHSEVDSLPSTQQPQPSRDQVLKV